jgi:hypothetical protein
MSILSKMAAFGGGSLIVSLVNPRIRNYGEIQELNIDKKNKAIFLKLQLKGEPAPVELRIENYDILNSDDATKFVVRKASSDREWLDALLRDFVVGRENPVPAEYASYLRDFLG